MLFGSMSWRVASSLCLVLLLGNFCVAQNNNAKCPRSCTCDGEKSSCNSLDDIKYLSADTKDLTFNLLKLTNLPARAFENLRNLKKLRIVCNSYLELDGATFGGLTSLISLDLSACRIQQLPLDLFKELRSLEILNLSNNNINQIEYGLFSNSPNLKSIYLDKNKLNRIAPEAFNSLPYLKTLLLEYNGPCDCGIYSIWQYMSAFSTVKLSCWTIDTKHLTSFVDLKPENFDCSGEPILLTGAHDLTLQPGQSAQLPCYVFGFPKPQINWLHNGQEYLPRSRILANGSLLLDRVGPNDMGTYHCISSNDVGSIRWKSVTVTVLNENTIKQQQQQQQQQQHQQQITTSKPTGFPSIILAPQNQTIVLGKSIILQCDADGHPMPTISWSFNGKPLQDDGRHVMMLTENTELLISEARVDDAGPYICTATNEHGSVTSTALIKVEGRHSAPRIIDEPFDIEAIVGTTIELPCRTDDNEALKITWRHDGRSIPTNQLKTGKYYISKVGNLNVHNVTVRDGGRYECSLTNAFGRATASAHVTIRNIKELAPGDRYVRIAFMEAAKEIDLAINNTVDMLFSNRSNGEKNFGDLLRLFRFPNGEARELARAAEIYERTLVNIRKHVQKGENLSIESNQYEFRDLLSREHLHLVAELSGCMEPRAMPNCTDMCFHAKYRSIDGTCNNLRHPQWGASLTAFRRIESPIYENGFSMPIGWTKGKKYAGFTKPSARLISTQLISTKEITPDTTITHMVMQWGQFLDHDLDHAIPSVSSESWDGVDCKKSCELAPPCYPIEVPPNDPRITNRRCIDIVRSSSICGSGMTSVFFESVQHREQINQLTAYIDASQMYGFNYEFAQELRNLTTDDGLLRVGVSFPQQKPMLPFAAPQDGMDCRRNLDESTMSCFVSGDIRVNEQVGLLAMHTIWMREHNRLAQKLREINPHWDGDTIYQEARKIVGAQMQHITFKQWLPLIIGESGMQLLGEYRGYDSSINPTIANEFATAALRFGHTIINPILHRLNSSYQEIPEGHLKLHKAFFAPWRLGYEGGVDPLMRGMFAVPAKLKTPGQNLNTELTEKLFQTAHAVALDLAAMNVQRGRDHGIPGYNVYRKFCNMSVAKSFDDLAQDIPSAEVRQKLAELYGHPDNMDVWVGGVLEEQLPGAKVGPLFQCLLVEQFRRLRDGDRFYYENPSVFLPEQLQQIKEANLGRVLCDNGDHIVEATENVFILPQRQGGFKSCEDIAGINLYFWQDCGTCNNNLSPLLSTYVPETYPKHGSRLKRVVSTDNDIDPLVVAHNLASESNNNEQRIVELEEALSNLHQELHRMQKKLRRLEEGFSTDHFRPKHGHCTDEKGTTRINNEVWTPDACTRCNCHHAQITCTHEQCAPLVCADDTVMHKESDNCCPQCIPYALVTQNNKQNSNSTSNTN